MNIHKSQLFWCELQGYKVLTHCQIRCSRQWFLEEFWPVCSNVVYWHILTMTVSLSTFWNPLPCHESYRHCIVGQPLLGWSVTNQELFYFKFISHTFVGYVCLRVTYKSHMSISSLFLSISVPFVVRIQDDLFFTAQGSHLALSAYVTSSSLDRSASGCQNCLVKWGYSWMV